jgi:hypothetical protein
VNNYCVHRHTAAIAMIGTGTVDNPHLQYTTRYQG